MLRRPRLLVALAVAVGASGLGVAGHALDWLPAVEQDTLRARFALRGTSTPSGITMVAIDPETFASLDEVSWPYPRSLHARVIDRLRKAGARLIVYDVQFTEATKPDEDAALFESVRRAGNVILATSEIGDGGSTNVFGGNDNVAAAHAEVGAANVESGANGVVERVPYSVGGLRSLAVVTVERDRGSAIDARRFPAPGAWIDYRGGPGTFPTISFSDVLRGHFDRRLVRDRIIVVGASVPSLQDLHATPTSGDRLMAGPEVQAHAIDTVRRGMPVRDAPDWAELLLLLALGAVPPLLAVRVRVLVVVLSGLAAFGVLLAATQAAFDAGIVLGATWPALALLTSLGGTVVAGYVEANARRQRVSRLNDELERRVRERTEDLRESHLEVVRRLAMAAEHRDTETGRHIERIGLMCHRLAFAAGLPAEDAERIGHAAILHDVGKIAVRDAVLLKPGAFTPEERRMMERHAQAGADILAGSRSELIREAEVIARTHHERWDGSGYPAGLTAEDIPLAGRICAICDVFDALVSQRVYKPAMTLDEAVETIRAGRGREFDPRLVDLFLPLARGLYEALHRDEDGPEHPWVLDLSAPRQEPTVTAAPPRGRMFSGS